MWAVSCLVVPLMTFDGFIFLLLSVVSEGEAWQGGFRKWSCWTSDQLHIIALDLCLPFLDIWVLWGPERARIAFFLNINRYKLRSIRTS